MSVSFCWQYNFCCVLRPLDPGSVGLAPGQGGVKLQGVPAPGSGEAQGDGGQDQHCRDHL